MSKRSLPVAACCPDLAALLPPRLFKALCDPNRVSLLGRLSGCTSCTVSEAASCCDVDLSVVSRHLGILRDAGVVEARRQGKEVHYSIRAGWLASVLRSIADALDGCACAPEPSPPTTAPAQAKEKKP